MTGKLAALGYRYATAQRAQSAGGSGRDAAGTRIPLQHLGSRAGVGCDERLGGAGDARDGSGRFRWFRGRRPLGKLPAHSFPRSTPVSRNASLTIFVANAAEEPWVSFDTTPTREK